MAITRDKGENLGFPGGIAIKPDHGSMGPPEDWSRRFRPRRKVLLAVRDGSRMAITSPLFALNIDILQDLQVAKKPQKVLVPDQADFTLALVE
ncbi:MAG: hypothetical protein WAT23_14225 [Chromatiaceae bacterium]